MFNTLAFGPEPVDGPAAKYVVVPGAAPPGLLFTFIKCECDGIWLVVNVTVSTPPDCPKT